MELGRTSFRDRQCPPDCPSCFIYFSREPRPLRAKPQHAGLAMSSMVKLFEPVSTL